MKKFISLLSVMLIACLTLSCAGAAAPAPEEADSPVVNTVQDRVVEIVYDTFDFDAGAEYLNKYDLSMGGCSAIRVLVDGKVYVGRDYDFYCSDTPAVIVRNNAGPIRTIGVANSPSSFDEWSEDFEVRDEVLTAAPYLCCDVMSEAGLY